MQRLVDALASAGVYQRSPGVFVHELGQELFIAAPRPDGTIEVSDVLEDIEKQMPYLGMELRRWLARNL